MMFFLNNIAMKVTTKSLLNYKIDTYLAAGG